MILLIDNYDSFVFNLARYLEELGEAVEVVRNDALDVGGIRARGPEALLVSPGPCTPAEAGVSVEAIRALAGVVPILGVCLGHQCIGEAFGARVVRAREPMHGKLSRLVHDGTGLFTGLPSPLRATRYHSLVLEPASVEPPLRITARSETEEVMAVASDDARVWGVQFHPEAILTEGGHDLLANFLALARGQAPAGASDRAVPRELSKEPGAPAGGT